jgi:hypothetical protein
VNTPQANPFELRRLQVGYDGSVARFAFDLGRAFLRAEELRELNAPTAASAAGLGSPGIVSVGGTLENPDA